jgi:acyl-CoA reductase-like NAD-dependent aldehyde dehydrogenase
MSARMPVQKTYKLFIGGEFPRSESGRSFPFSDVRRRVIANVAQASRKDFRNAVVAARGAAIKWAARSGYNRGQILYRLGEILEGRREQFIAEIHQQGSSIVEARREVDAAIDCLIHYAGWSDKYQALFSSVNPVASPHFSFSVTEPTGVVALIAPENSALLGLVSVLAPTIVGGNAVISIAAEKKPLTAITFAEVVATSDVPPGVVNILTGCRQELLPHIAGHRDVNAIVCPGANSVERKTIQAQASLSVKRAIFAGWSKPGLYAIIDTQEIKTTWHPIGL